MKNEIDALQTQKYIDIESNPLYSLVVDPDDKYHMSSEQKEFIKTYMQVKNIGIAAEVIGIELETARVYYFAQSTQNEINRLTNAMYKRQFATRMLNLNEIAGYLTSQLTDMNVPIADRLKPTEKLKVAQMLIDLNKLRIDVQSTTNPSDISSLNEQIKQLSVDTIKQLLDQTEQTSLSEDETDYLTNLQPDELLSMLDEMNTKGGDK